MIVAVDQKLIADLARNVVAETAPQELPLFRPVSEAYFREPKTALHGKRGKDEMLGFGVGEAITLVTPVVLAIMTDVVTFLAGELQKTFKEESAGIIGDLVKKLFKKYHTGESGTSAAATLTKEQLAKVRQIALEKARQLSLPENKAQLLADSMVGSLVTA